MYGPNPWDRVLGRNVCQFYKGYGEDGELFWHSVGYHIGAAIVLGFHSPMAYL